MLVEIPRRNLAYKVDLHVLDSTRPSIETENFIREIDAFICRQVVNLASPGAWS